MAKDWANLGPSSVVVGLAAEIPLRRVSRRQAEDSEHWSSILEQFVQEFESLEVLADLRRLAELRLAPCFTLSLRRKLIRLSGPKSLLNNAADIYARVRELFTMVRLKRSFAVGNA